MLLQDPEWCKLASASRPLAKLARGVTHTFINNLRSRYGVKKGDLLTEERIQQVDGTPPPAWAAVLKTAATWDVEQVNAIRIGETWADVRPGWSGSCVDARALRIEELARPWPWPNQDGETAREAHSKTLDTLEDLDAALISVECPEGVRSELRAAFDACRACPDGNGPAMPASFRSGSRTRLRAERS